MKKYLPCHDPAIIARFWPKSCHFCPFLSLFRHFFGCHGHKYAYFRHRSHMHNPHHTRLSPTSENDSYTSDIQKTLASAYHLYISEWICYRFIALEPREYPQMAQHFMIKGGRDHYIMDHADCCRSQYGSTLI